MTKPKLVLYGGAALALLLLGFQIANWYRPPKVQTLYRAVPVPYVAERSPLLAKAEREEKCVPTVVYRLPEKQAERLGVKESDDVLTAVKLRPAPYGGSVTVRIPRPTLEIPNPEAEVVVVPQKTPFWELTPARSLSGWVGVGGSDGFTAGRVIGAELRQGLFRSGAVEWDLRAGALMVGDQSSWWVGVGGTVKF